MRIVSIENKNNRVELSRMSQDIVVNQADQFSNDDLSSPIGAQNFGICNPQLFPDTIKTPEVTSFSNGCYDEKTFYASNISFPQNAETNAYQDNSIATNIMTPGTHTKTSTISTATNRLNDVNLSVLFESRQGIRNDLSSTLNVPTSPEYLVPPYLISRNMRDELPNSSMPPAVPPIDVIQGLHQYHVDSISPLTAPQIPPIYEEDDCLSLVSSFLTLNPSTPPCSFLTPAMRPFLSRTSTSNDNLGFLTKNLPTGPELHTPKLEYPGDNSMIFSPDLMPRVFNAPELQVLGTENQAGEATGTTSLASEITSLDDPTLRVGKLSVEQRREKINRYLKKRSERNFSKKIKYACRKTLADSRPRVRGRFAKNDDFGETDRSFSSNQDEDDGGGYVFDTEDSQSTDLDYY